MSLTAYHITLSGVDTFYDVNGGIVLKHTTDFEIPGERWVGLLLYGR
jgi:hypothetical protein